MMAKRKTSKTKLRRSLQKKQRYDARLEKKRLKPNGVTGGIVDAYNIRLDMAVDQKADQDAVSMVDLLEDYNISKDAEDRWFRLAFALAREYVPAFQMEAGPRGRKQKWTEEARLKLYARVSYRQSQNPGQSASEICSHLAKSYGMKHGTLYSQYKKAKREITRDIG